METFEIVDLVTMQHKIGERYLEFFTGSEHLSLGLYSLKEGEEDPQTPHTEDEIYYVVSGHAMINVDGEDRTVKPGSVIFVGTGVDHKFHTITENLLLLVVFAPPRRSRASS